MNEPIQLEGSADKNKGIPVKLPQEKGKNEQSFGDIFAKSEKKEKDSKMVQSIVAEKDALKKMKPILGASPLFEENLEKERALQLKRKLRLAQSVFVALLIVSLGAAFYFYSELSPNFDLFGTNVTRRLHDVNLSLRKLQTQSNKFRYLSSQLDLDQFSYEADRFFGLVKRLQNETSTIKKRELLVAVEESKKSLPLFLETIRQNLSRDVVLATFLTEGEPEQTEKQVRQQFEEDMRNLLQEDRKKLAAASDNFAELQDLKLVNNTLKLVGNETLVRILKQVSIDNFKKDLDDFQKNADPQKEKALRELIAQILSSTQSDLATIASIKQNRVEWSTIIQQIEAETANVDKNYGQPALFDKLGGVMYTGYEFDSIQNKITLSGAAKTINGDNFTLLSNLIDQLEQSVHFENVDMRSFPKNKTGPGTPYEGYISHFKINLKLESQEFSTKNKALSLESAVPVSDGVKRSSQ
jgi:hypothetical protein